MPSLTESELKVLMAILRQTFGWKDSVTGGRKQRDRISGWQFGQKTGLSRRVVTKAIQSLCDRRLIEVTDFGGNPMLFGCERKGKRFLYYRALVPDISGQKTSAQRSYAPAHNRAHNKTNSTKTIRTPHSVFDGHVSIVLSGRSSPADKKTNDPYSNP